MKKALLAAGLVAAMVSAPLRAEMVTARWGVKGPIQHPGTLTYEPAGTQGTLMLFDLSALPRGADVCRARLFFSGVNWKEKGFDIVPARRHGTGKDAKIDPAGPQVAPAGPSYQWLDATEAVRGWARKGSRAGLLWMRGRRAFNREATYLEIAYEGKAPAELPKQVTGVQAFCRSGQVFITFKETDPPDGGKQQPTWAEVMKKFGGDYYGPVSVPGQGVTYQVYTLDRPITPATIGRARLLGEVLPGSAFNTRFALRTDPARKTAGLVAIQAGRRGEGMAAAEKVTLVRAAVEPGKPLGPATGLYVHTVDRAGAFHYAVLAARDGVVNAADISPGNSVGPVRQKIDKPRPVLYTEFVTPVGKAKYHEQWYSYWTVQPLSMWPARYDVVVGFCPELMAKPAPLDIPRSGWNCWPRPPRPHSTTGMVMVHTADKPVDFRTGLHDSIGTLKGFDEGSWKPFFSNRQAALAEWMCSQWPIDRSRISAGLGSWGLQEIRYGDLYALISGGGLPEVTKGWQAWQRAHGIWGRPEMYRGRPAEENPYVVSNVTDWVLAHPEKRLPYVWTSAPGAHEDEMGWPPYPRFVWAMMKTKRPFLYDYSRQTPVAKAIRDGRIQLRLGQSLPAFAHCSLDDNLGEGELHSGMTLCPAQVNGYLLWDSATIVDEPSRWQISVWLADSAPWDECTVELTPRYCRKFKAKPGRKCRWTNLLVAESTKEGDKQAPRRVLEQAGRAEADQYGLVTVRRLMIIKAKHRITIGFE